MLVASLDVGQKSLEVITRSSEMMVGLKWNKYTCYNYNNKNLLDLSKFVSSDVCDAILRSNWAKEQTSPTPWTSTVDVRRKSTISADRYRNLNIKINGVTIGDNSSSMI